LGEFFENREAIFKKLPIIILRGRRQADQLSAIRHNAWQDDDNWL
jgi:hypothetical protein